MDKTHTRITSLGWIFAGYLIATITASFVMLLIKPEWSVYPTICVALPFVVEMYLGLFVFAYSGLRSLGGSKT